jgi:hypothetical protein
MALDARLNALSRERQDSCPMRRLLDSLPDQTAGILEDLLADDSCSTLRLHQALRAEGYKISRDTISAHRAGRCYCNEGEQ